MVQVSPGVVTREIDLTTVVPAVSTTEAGIAGVFRWGPLNKRVLIDSETKLVARFGKPTNFNFETWFTASSFLAYGDTLYVVRVGNVATTDTNVATHSALANVGAVANVLAQIVLNEDDYASKDGTFDTDVLYIAKYPGDLGNSLRISVCDSANQFNSTLSLSNSIVTGLITANIGSNTVALTFVPSGGGTITDANTMATATISALSNNDLVEIGNSTIGTQYLRVTGVPTTPTTNSTVSLVTLNVEDPNRLAYDHTSNTISRYWEFYSVVDVAPGQSDYVAVQGNTSANDELHLVVVDDGGKFTGVPGSVLEVYKALSRASDAKNNDGGGNYYKTIINDVSQYVWLANDRSNAVSNTALTVASSTNSKPLNIRFAGGNDGANESNAAFGLIASGYDLFASAEDLDISLILQGKARGGAAGGQLANYLIDNIAEIRQDCVVFVSPDRNDVVNNPNDEVTDIITFRNTLRSSSYAFLDSGYKYMYDKYNDVFRFVPLNGDTAGLCVRTDNTNDAWWSPAGFNRGNIKNVAKLSYNPKKAERDLLYKSGINPVVTFPGQGTVLYGDKTLLAKPSAFDRINVRRLFIVLRKAIARAAQYTLFEFNDDFTRAQFRNLVNPYLRDVQGRRGITDFLVVCDESNNTGEVIDRNEFIGDIYIKPARSINFITLNFIAVRTDVQFSEVVGKF
jgi:phage tail sheath protein FI